MKLPFNTGITPINTFVVPFLFEDFILGCVDSIWSHCDPLQHRLIVVDNSGETDLQITLSKRCHLYIKSYRNLGCAKAWNLGIAASDTEYITIMGDDTRILHKNWWPEVYEHIKDDPLGVWFCHPCHSTQPSKVAGELEPPEFTDEMWEETKKQSGDMPGRFNALILRRSVLPELQCGPDFFFNEDLYPCERLDGHFKLKVEGSGRTMQAIHYPVWHMRAMTFQSGKTPAHDRGMSNPNYKECPEERRHL